MGDSGWNLDSNLRDYFASSLAREQTCQLEKSRRVSRPECASSYLRRSRCSANSEPRPVNIRAALKGSGEAGGWGGFAAPLGV